MSLARALDRFFRHDAAGGVLLMASALMALIVANSALSGGYHDLLLIQNWMPFWVPQSEVRTKSA